MKKLEARSMHIIIDLLNKKFYSAETGNRLGLNVNGILMTPDLFDVAFITKRLGSVVQISSSRVCIIVPDYMLQQLFSDPEYHLTIIDYHTNK